MHKIFDSYRKTWQDHWAHQRPERFVERAIRRTLETQRSQHVQSTKDRKKPKPPRRTADASSVPSFDSFLEFGSKSDYFQAGRRTPGARVSERRQR